MCVAVSSHQKLFLEKLNLFNFWLRTFLGGLVRCLTILDSHRAAKLPTRWRCIGDVHEEKEMYVIQPQNKGNQLEVMMVDRQ